VPTFNSLTSRTDVASLIPEEVSRDMLARATEQSAALAMFRRIPVGRAQVRFPILSALPVAYWVNGDTGLKQTTEINWSNKYLNIEEIATIVPIPDNVLADVDANIWDEAMPFLIEAFGRTLDSAIFFGVNAPGSFPSNVATAAAAAGNAITEGTAAASGGYLGDLDKVYGALDSDGFDATGIVAATSFKGKLRGARDSTGQKIDSGRVAGRLDAVDTLPIAYPMRGMWPSGGAAGTSIRAFVGDWNQFVIGIRQDISLKILDQAVITDAAGLIIYNLPQQDMTALRLTFRVGWQVANLPNWDQPTDASRYPVASLVY
jgi:HK97 family phage major capsid protein